MGLKLQNRYARSCSSDVVIVALTANAIKGDREKFLSCGMNDYLSKPIDSAELEKILRKYSNGQKVCVDIEKILQQVNENIGASKEVGIKVLKLFLESLQELVPVLEEAFLQQDNKTIYATAHKLKGAAGALYLQDIFESMQEIEKSAAEENAMHHSNKTQLLYEYIEVFKKGLAQYH